ncbi:MAG: hypothetical protein HOY71_07055, partial [Nonomuraea sp.]|nr:hypothetical protein [Nonomuraea sp.]
DNNLAAGLRTETILADPSGRLARLQAEVGRRYAEPEWVRRRCAEVERRIRDGLPGADAMGRLFLTGVTTHVLLTAALRNPTVRTRYVAVRALLAERGLLDVHEELLGLLGSAGMSRAEVEDELAVMTAEFDRAASVEGVPYAFASDISARARPIAVDATRELIGRGLHREIYFWIAATRLRCARILGTEPPPLRLGDTLGYLPRLTEVKELVLAG